MFKIKAGFYETPELWQDELKKWLSIHEPAGWHDMGLDRKDLMQGLVALMGIVYTETGSVELEGCQVETYLQGMANMQVLHYANKIVEYDDTGPEDVT